MNHHSEIRTHRKFGSMPEIKIVPSYIKSPNSLNSTAFSRNTEDVNVDKDSMQQRRKMRLVGNINSYCYKLTIYFTKYF